VVPTEELIPLTTHDVHAFEFHNQLDAHRHESRLSEVILGGQDGLVNVLGVILGVAAATNDPRIVLAAGMAATFAESLSMGAVAYTSTQADRALYESEMAREHRHIHLVPALERDEIREIYREKGFDGALLDQIVETITSNKDVWVAVMMAEELKLVPVHHHAAMSSAIIVGLAAIVGSLIPLAPFILIPVLPAMIISIAIAGATLFGVGAYKAHTTVGHWGKSGVEMAAIGVACAIVGYIVGWIFRVPATP
jgi:VIT1/CCC1 family predicted Fe2+/Mn2+ transporter